MAQMPQGPQHAMTPGDGAAALAKASKALAGAKAFTKSVEGTTTSKVASPAPKPAAAAPKPVQKDTTNLPAELNAKAATVNEYTAATPKFHKGGKIKKDGVQKIDAEAGETVLPNKGKKRVMELAMKHLDGMKEGMEHASKKHAAKSAHKSKHGKVHKMHVHVNDDDTFSMTHEHHPDADGNPMADTTHSAPDMDGLMDHMQQHLGTPNPGEAEASAPPPAAGAPAMQ